MTAGGRAQISPACNGNPYGNSNTNTHANDLERKKNVMSGVECVCGTNWAFIVCVCVCGGGKHGSPEV